MDGKNISVYDNGGRTFDRYTVIIDDCIYSMSEEPNHPQGFNQFCCNTHELSSRSGLGKRVPFISLPPKVQAAILERAGDL